jgi:hypothetical protein
MHLDEPTTGHTLRLTLHIRSTGTATTFPNYDFWPHYAYLAGAAQAGERLERSVKGLVHAHSRCLGLGGGHASC